MEADKQPLDPLMDTLWKFTYRLPGIGFYRIFLGGERGEIFAEDIFFIPVRFLQRGSLSFDS